MRALSDLVAEAEQKIEAASELAALDLVRVDYMGKKGELTARLKGLSALPAAERPAAGQEINQAKKHLQNLLNARREALDNLKTAKAEAAEAVDVTLPGRGYSQGSIHPISRTRYRIEAIFRGAGFDVCTGPEIEDEYHNFSALNIPDNHPARAMHDTFYLDQEKLLRTHTSPVQIRAMSERGVPLRVIAPGRVYRCDSDQTHTPMFHQVEGLVIDKGVSFANLKAVLHQFIESFFERKAALRFRASYFPFTEPSAEVDVEWSEGKWLEILGCGMVHPNVLKMAGIDPDVYTGYAFGMGIERLAMLRYGVKDLRQFFENDLRFLQQFN